MSLPIHIQCGAIITRSVFSQIFTKYVPWLTPLGQGMRCILWVQTVIYTLPQSMQWCMHRACLFSKSSLARLQEFWNSSIRLYEIKRKNLFKSTCPTGSFTCPGLSDSGKRRALMQYHVTLDHVIMALDYMHHQSSINLLPVWEIKQVGKCYCHFL